MDPAAAKELCALSRGQLQRQVTALGDSDVQRFYSNSVVLVTGGSGFLGKLLIEKLFRSSRIRKMFLLLRPKKGRTIQERLAEILKDPTQFLTGIGGKNLRSFATNMLRRILRDEVAEQYSLTWKKMKNSSKKSFLDTETCKLIFQMCKKVHGTATDDKLKEIISDWLNQAKLFQELHENQPGFQHQIELVEGDVSQLRLGMSQENWNTVVEEVVVVYEPPIRLPRLGVTVIFHGAATIKFDEPLKSAALINVRGTREILCLGKACKQLRSFVYVSTAYSHATFSRIGGEVLEQFYPTPVTPETVIQLAESFNGISDSIIEGWPNTYCFTKAIAEEAVRTMGADLPICVVRPAIVICAYQEPLPGWIDVGNLYGASGLGLGFTTGVIHVVYSKPHVKIDLVPVDLVINALLAAGKETVDRWDGGEKEIKIYTVTSARNSLTWEDCLRILSTEIRSDLSPKAVWYTFIFQASNKLIYSVLSFFLHYVPAWVVDSACIVMGKRPKLKTLYAKADKIASALKYFTLNDWAFDDRNMQKLYRNMSENDKIIYNCNITNINSTAVVIIWNLGLRKYILKDGLQGTEYALKKQKVLKLLTFVILAVSVCVLWMMFLGLYSCIKL